MIIISRITFAPITGRIIPQLSRNWDVRKPAKLTEVNLEFAITGLSDSDAFSNEGVALSSSAISSWTTRGDCARGIDDTVPWDWGIRARI
jgi:hypothetical protein